MRMAAPAALYLILVTGQIAASEPASVPIQAIYNNRLPELAAYLKNGGSANARGTRENTLLMYAAAYGSLDSLRLLLNHGADPNLKNSFDATALMWGAWDAPRVKLLLAKGADVNIAAKSGTTALLLAATSPTGSESVNLLASHHAGVTAVDSFGTNLLHAGANAGNLTAVRLGLASHLDVNARQRNGFTPLMNAAADGSVEIARLLLDTGADPNAISAPQGKRMKNGNIALTSLTPLILAAPYGPPAMTKLLLDHGAKVTPVDGRGMTALHAAVSSEVQNPETVQLLLAKGADPAFQNSEGKTARDWALKFARPDVLKCFAMNPPNTTAPAAPDIVPMVTREEATHRAMTLLETSTRTFFQQSGCVGCHSQNITGMAAGAARQHGVAIDGDAATERLSIVAKMWAPSAEGLLVRDDPPGGADTVAFALLGMAGEGYTPDLVTGAMVRNLAVQQVAEGYWHHGGVARVPAEDSDIGITAMAIRSLALFGNPGSQAEYSERIQRAAKWLASAKPRYAEDANMRLLGLKWAGAPAATVSQAAREVLAKQRPSGGWGQNDFLPEDAYATGQAIYALAEAGRANDPAVTRGTGYLIRTQAPDGSWHVVSRAVKFQPYFQGGFPYDHDQWISSMGTGWAAMALASVSGNGTVLASNLPGKALKP